jgi:hypothetical protein
MGNGQWGETEGNGEWAMGNGEDTAFGIRDSAFVEGRSVTGS